MDDLIDEVSRLRGDLQYYIEPFGLPIEAFEKAGADGVMELHEQGIPRENSIFANDLANKIEFVPLDVVRSMCLAATYLLAGLGSHKNGQPYAINFLMRGADEIGFIRGMAYGVTLQDSRNARFAAFARHAKDPKQKDKALVRECWDDWQKEPDRYKKKSAFAKDMLEKFPNLESQRVIADKWCPAWEKEKITPPAQ